MVRETGKQRSQRIQIDYFRHRGGLHRLRIACIAIGFLFAGAYAAYLLSYGGDAHVITGPVATVHASFEQDCQQCHQDFTPISSQATRLSVPVLGIRSEESIGHLERACQVCHAVGNHYRASMTSDSQLLDQNCGECHTDHQGRDFQLTNIGNNKCVVCHSNLSARCKSAPEVNDVVTSFTKSAHGDFASVSGKDSGVIKFDHHQHMLPGQIDEGQKGAFTIEMLESSLQAKYRQPNQVDTDPVQLNCQSCHRPAGNPDPQNTLTGDAELGRYMASVSFDEHCSACHAIHPAMATENTTPIPHAVPWSRVELLLAATTKGARNIGQARQLNDDTQTTAQPGSGLGTLSLDPSGADVSPTQLRKLVEVQCLKCHDNQSISDEVIASARAGAAPMIPARWFRSGIYDHAAHRKIDCRYCHEAAYPIDGEPASLPNDHETVMIGGIDSCTGCHRDETSPTPTTLAGSVSTMLGGQPTWASDDCTTCHRYHTEITGLSSTTRQDDP